MPVDEVELSVQGEIAFVQLRRPADGNAIRGPMFDSLRKVALRLQDAPPRYLVLSGEGSDFSRGLVLDRADPLYAMIEPIVRNRDAYRVQELLVRLRGAFDAIGRLPCPVIAAIEGRCHGVGLELALIADVRIAAEDATFAMPGAKRGVLTGLGGLVRLSSLLGTARANHLVLTGQAIGAAEALAGGLISTTCTPGSARAAAIDFVAELRQTNPTARLQAILATRAIQAKLTQDLFEHEVQAAARTWISGDWLAGLQAVESGEEPSW
jgi:enoyl-CoA hydratase/carnithine racemase